MPFVANPSVIWAVDNANAQSVVSKQIDHFGNIWVFTSPTGVAKCYSPTGTLLQTHLGSTLYNTVISFNYTNQVGSSWPLFSSGLYYTYHTILNDGVTSYLVQFAISNNSTITTFNSIAVFSLDASGDFTLEGSVWGNADVSPSSFFSALLAIDLCNAKTFDDPLFIWLESENGNSYGVLWPSINTIRAACAPSHSVRYRFDPSVSPGQTYFGLGGTALNAGLGSGSGYTAPVFLMPEGTSTQLFLYLSKNAMAANHASGGCPWVDTDLYPTYPNGVMVKAPLGVVTAPALDTTLQSQTIEVIVPAAESGCFIDTSGASYNAFADVETNWDGTGTRANIDYFAAPAPLAKDSEGGFQVGWYRPQFGDATYIGPDWAFFVRARVQTYSPATGLFTDQFQFSQEIATILDFGTPAGNVPNDIVALVQFAMFWSDDSLYVLNIDGTPATSSARNRTWLARLGTFYPPLPRRGGVGIHYHAL